MPLYEFRCNNCKKTFEKLYIEYYDRGEEILCPYCNSKNITKIFFPNKAIFKCKGFYETDYKNKK